MSDKRGNVVALRPMQFVSPPPAAVPPDPYTSFDQMDIVTLREYLRAKNLTRGWMGTNIHKDTAVALANGTMSLDEVAEWEWNHIVQKRGMMTDGKLRGWMRNYAPTVLARIGEAVDQIISPNDVEVKETEETMADLPKAPNLFALLNPSRKAADAAPAAAPAAAPVQVQTVPTLTVPAKAEPTKAEPTKAEPTAAGAVAPVETQEATIRQHPQWTTLAAVAKGLGIDLDGFVTEQQEAYGAIVGALEDRDARLRYLHTNLPKFIEAVFTEPNVPNV